MDRVGVIHGRFQVLHKDHMKYLLAGKSNCEHLIIGISNPEDELTKYSDSNPHRSQKNSNPMTYFERFECIRDSLIEYGVDKQDFDIVPFPINYPDKLFNYVPFDATFYMTIYDKWGIEKYNVLKDKLGLNVKVMWQVELENKGLSASDVRQRIFEGKEWCSMVPESVYSYLVKHKIDKRIADLLKEESRPLT